MVRESLLERETLWRNAPHIIWPLRFVLPHERHLHAISATMGQREPQHRAVFEISEVTPDAVRDQVVSFLAEVLRG